MVFDNCFILCFKKLFYTAPRNELDKIYKSPDFKTDFASKVSEDAEDRSLCSSKALYHRLHVHDNKWDIVLCIFNIT